MELNEQILFMAFRYALGRMTYVVGEVSDTIIRKWPEISPKYRKLIQSEICEAIDSERAGWEMDVKAWERILKLES